MKIDLTKISGEKKNVWWMNAATGELTYVCQCDNKVKTFSQQNPTPGHVYDGVLIVIDSSKNYIAKDQKQISNMSLADKTRNLNE